MGRKRDCVRCGAGTETCVFGDFYTCSVCDVETIDEPVDPDHLVHHLARKMNEHVHVSKDDLRYRLMAMGPPPMSYGTFRVPFSLSSPKPMINPPPMGLSRSAEAHLYTIEVDRVFRDTKTTLPNYRRIQAALDSHRNDFLVRPRIIENGPSLQVSLDWSTPCLFDARESLPQEWITAWTRAGL